MSPRFGLALALTLATASAQARPRGSLVIKSVVDGAVVEIDGKAVGRTPLSPQALPSGVHTLRVHKLGYLEHSERVMVGAGRRVLVTVDLLPFAGVLACKSDVPGAKVEVDGKVVGTTPLEYEVKLGRHEITISASGYAPFTTDVRADPGNTYPVVARLKKQRGAGEDLELAAIPIEPLTPPRKGQKDDGLELEPLVELAPLPKKEENKATSVAAVAPTEGIQGAVEPAKPWYMQYWVWGAAAAVVAGGVLVAALATGGGDNTLRVDCVWAPGEGGSRECSDSGIAIESLRFAAP